ncbi:type I secretion system membrane fusion protein PrsE [Variibacter gotjawalensis]|uniref:Membrane fusion protein (MFP) family protein n=1 Tax=Variibacter gotjawalensis TaxID=1333996 RepID=A0A0S3PXR4_9BRAD|nr:HlyD family type I secretion periplasmic adaptor subunit [Variibacter gotjawalensis]NIK46578.1 HlyD family secretion protein [Variibacter gotjawalensis]RZS48482.1 membrane fusion protein PrsE [Variibacter gotjawalensis]BAT60744.1 type I secretion system membrane fusion protein PrsE [Variibacter gotjawalensis]
MAKVSAEHSLAMHGRIFALSFIALVGGSIALATGIDASGAIIAAGNLVVDSELKKVQHPSGGVVTEILINEGTKVAQGDIVMRLDPTVAKATLNAVTKDLWELAARKARLEAEREGEGELAFPPELTEAASDPALAGILVGEQRLFRSRNDTNSGQKAQLRERIDQLKQETNGIKGQLEAKRKELELIGRELEGVNELWEKKLVPITRVTILEREKARLGGETGRLEAAFAQTRGKISETELQIIQVDQTMRSDIGKELADIRAKMSELTEKRTAALDQSQRIDIRAPQSGTVLQLSVHTVGGVVAGGEQLMQIVPEADRLTVEARIRPADIDRVQVGQSASLRFSNVDRRTTPEFDGTVVRVSADAVKDDRVDEPYFVVRVRFDRGEAPEALKLVPGMPLEVFIRTDSRSLMSYIVKPLTDQVRHAFRER